MSKQILLQTNTNVYLQIITIFNLTIQLQQNYYRMNAPTKNLVRIQQENQAKPEFINPVCMKTFQLLPKIYGHIKIKKDNHKNQKLLYQHKNKSPIQTNKNIFKQQVQTRQYFSNNSKKKQQAKLLYKSEQFQTTIQKPKQQLINGLGKNKYQCGCKCKSQQKISSLSLYEKNEQIKDKHAKDHLLQKSIKMSSPKSFYKLKLRSQCQDQMRHKVKVNEQQKRITSLFKDKSISAKNHGLYSLIREVNQKNLSKNSFQRTKSQALKTPGRSTHYRTNSLYMVQIQEEQQLNQQDKLNAKIKFRRKLTQNEKMIGKNIKINQKDILLSSVRQKANKKSRTQPNEGGDKQFNVQDTKNRKNLFIKDKRQRKNFHVPQKQQISHFLKSYKPILQNFSLQQIINSPSFMIIYQDQNKKLYLGQTKNQLRHGRGIKLSKSSIFQGQFVSGLKKYGIQITIDGVYKGPFKNQKREGQGIFTWNNGQKFEGRWKNNLKQGFGRWTSPKGDEYQGNWSLNKQNGYGVFKSNLSIYKGNFKDFLKHGDGEQHFKNGDRYIGEYQFGKPTGSGVYLWKDGQKYQGHFINGLRQGEGILQTPSGQYYKAKASLKMILNTEKDYQNNLANKLFMVYSNMVRFQKMRKLRKILQKLQHLENDSKLFIFLQSLKKKLLAFAYLEYSNDFSINCMFFKFSLNCPYAKHIIE